MPFKPLPPTGILPRGAYKDINRLYEQATRQAQIVAAYPLEIINNAGAAPMIRYAAPLRFYARITSREEVEGGRLPELHGSDSSNASEPSCDSDSSDGACTWNHSFEIVEMSRGKVVAVLGEGRNLFELNGTPIPTGKIVEATPTLNDDYHCQWVPGAGGGIDSSDFSDLFDVEQKLVVVDLRCEDNTTVVIKDLVNSVVVEGLSA